MNPEPPPPVKLLHAQISQYVELHTFRINFVHPLHQATHQYTDHTIEFEMNEWQKQVWSKLTESAEIPDLIRSLNEFWEKTCHDGKMRISVKDNMLILSPIRQVPTPLRSRIGLTIAPTQ